MTASGVVIVIPARYGSTRLPGKPLVSLAGKPMIERVYERAKQAKRAGGVVGGAERIAEVAAHTEGDVFVNVQGDEPLLDPAAVDTAVNALLEEPAAAIATVAVLIRTPADIMDPNTVKTVVDFEDNAIYFSRALIPWVRDTGMKTHARHLKHLGLYVFQREALLEYPTLPQGELERIEQLEQLRWLEK